MQKVSGPGRFNIVTVVEWASSEAMESAQQVMRRRYEEEGFVPGEFMSRLSIDADLANYTALPDPAADDLGPSGLSPSNRAGEVLVQS